MIGQNQKKSWGYKLIEALRTLLFLRPAVDAYRISTNHVDEEAMFDSLIEVTMNKNTELTAESIPGCVLQMYVWLSIPKGAGELSCCLPARKKSIFPML